MEADVNSLWELARLKHPGATSKAEIAAFYAAFEAWLQRAADELETCDPPRAGWAAELIHDYTKPTHRFPAVSKSLDYALTARSRLILLTDKEAVETIERKLHRFKTEEKTRPWHHFRLSATGNPTNRSDLKQRDFAVIIRLTEIGLLELSCFHN